MNAWCTECGGARTRSAAYTPGQPEDSPLCAPCWYIAGGLLPALLDLHALDALPPEVWTPALIGRLVDWHGDICPLVQCADGAIRIQVQLTCGCGRVSAPMYASSGLHAGAWPYIRDFNGTYLGCIRDQAWRCDRHEGE